MCASTLSCVGLEQRQRLLLQGVDLRVALGLAVLLRVERVGEAVADQFLNPSIDFLIALRRGEFALRLAGLGDEFPDAGDDLLAALVAELDGRQHLLFGRFARPGLDHHNAVFGAGDGDVELGALLLFVGRLDHRSAVHHRHSHAAQHVVERNVGQRQRRRRAIHGHRAGVVRRIGRQHQADDLRLAGVPFREQRADRPVDQAGGEDLTIAHAAFAFQEPAGDPSRGVGVFTIVNGQRKERSARLRLPVGTGGAQHHRFAESHRHGAMRLLSEFPCFQGQDPATQVDFN